jgi:hypothetical protein
MGNTFNLSSEEIEFLARNNSQLTSGMLLILDRAIDQNEEIMFDSSCKDRDFIAGKISALKDTRMEIVKSKKAYEEIIKRVNSEIPGKKWGG